MAKKKRSHRAVMASVAGLALFVLVVGLAVFGRLAQAALATMAARTTPPASWQVALLNLALVVASMALPLVLCVQLAPGRERLLASGRWVLPFWVLLPLFLGTVVVVNSLASLMQLLAQHWLGAAVPDPEPLPDGALALALYVLAVCVAPAVLEELLFRGAVQRLLRGYGPRLAIVTTAVLFTLLHARLWDAVPLLASSLLLGHVAEMTGGVQAGMALHFANNFFVFALRLARQHMQPTAAFALMVWLIVLLLAGVAEALWALRHLGLARRLRVRRDAQALGPAGRRLARLLRVPLFLLGCAAVVAWPVLRWGAAG